MKIAAALFFTAVAGVALWACFWKSWGVEFAVFSGIFGAIAIGYWRDIWEQERWRFR